MANESSEDCLPCRLTTGFGCLFIGLYLFYNTSYSGPFNRILGKAIAIGFGGVGSARLFNLPPFRSTGKASE